MLYESKEAGMKKIMRIVPALTILLLVHSAPAFADRGGSGGHGGGHDGGHGGGHVSYGVVIGPGWWNPYPYYPYYPYPYYPYYPYYPQPPVVIEETPEIYVQPAPQAAEDQFWYFCPEPQGFYPDVKKCPKGWLKVVPPDILPEEEE
jgi:hypothetical protein